MSANSGLPELGDLKQLDIPVIAIIANDCQRKADIFAHGFADYISHPFIAEEILARIYNADLRPPASPPLVARPGNPTNRRNDLVERTCQFLTTDITFDRGLENLAKAMGTNRNTLSQAFRGTFGHGALSWLRELRLSEAARLLVQTDLSVQEVALNVGYGDSNNFSTSFKRKYERSPVEYRQFVSQSKNIMSDSKARK